MKYYLSALLLSSLVAISQVNNYYFGNLHAHTAFSDGNKDSLISGIKDPAGSYAYAKLSNDFDFLGVSEHNHYSSLRNPGFKLPRYQSGLAMANAANEDGVFVSMFGMEYGVSSSYHGHVIIYGFNQLIGWETSVPGVNGNNYDLFNGKDDYDGLFKKVKNNPNAFCYLAHPWYSDYSPDGTSSGGVANAAYNATYDSAIVGMPLRNGLATSSLSTYSDYSTGNYFDYYRKMLAIGYHLGIGYDHDSHYSNFGRSNGGRLVIIAPTLTQANIVLAMQKMHFYGSDDSNAKIEFTLNNNIMGSVVTGTDNPTFSVIHNDPDGEQADSIKIWRGFGNNAFGTWSSVVLTTLQNNTATYTDLTVAANTEYHYFAEIRQADGQWIVTSPIWYTKTPSAVVNSADEIDNSAFKFNYFPNPVKQNLSVSVSECGDYALSVNDLSGRAVLTTCFNELHCTIDLSTLERGVYTLIIENKRKALFKKLIIE